MAEDLHQQISLHFSDTSAYETEIFKDKSLGSGAYGMVCRATYNQLPCAAKLLHSLFLTPESWAVDKFVQECDFLSSLKHPNIVQFLGVHTDPSTNQTALLMELMDESLTTLLSRHSLDHPVPLHTQVDVCHDISLALHYLHINAIIHRDLSSNNVLLLGGRRAKLTDFGMSKLTPNSTPLLSMTQVPGCPVYMPPEAWVTPPIYTNKLDIFSMGVIMVQVATCKVPNPGPMEELIPDQRSPTGYLKLPVSEVDRRSEDIALVSGDHPLREMIIKCLNDKPDSRPTAKELCQQLNTLKMSQQYIESSQTSSHPVTMATKQPDIQPKCSCDGYCAVHGQKIVPSASIDHAPHNNGLQQEIERKDLEMKELQVRLDASVERTKVLESDNAEQATIIRGLREKIKGLTPHTKSQGAKKSGRANNRVEITGLCTEILVEMRRSTSMYNMQYDIEGGSISVLVPEEDNKEQDRQVMQTVYQVYQHMFNSGQVRVGFLPIPATFPAKLVPKCVAIAAAFHYASRFEINEAASVIKIISGTPEVHEKSVKFVRERLDLRRSLDNGKRTFTLKKGDIVNEDCSIIVSAANPSLSHRWGVSAAINVASQFELQKHCNEYLKTNPTIRIGDIAVTEAGGNLKCQWIIHAVGPSGLLRDDKSTNQEFKQEIIDCMKDLTHKILTRAEKLGATSVALPAISTGSIMLPSSIAAAGIIGNIINFNFAPSSSLTDIRLIVLRQDIFEAFVDEFVHFSLPQRPGSPDFKKQSSDPTPSSSSPKADLASKRLFSAPTGPHSGSCKPQ